jgi:hypothetical protein
MTLQSLQAIYFVIVEEKWRSTMDYSEKPKVSWSAIVVTLAVLLFGCIIAFALLWPRLQQAIQGGVVATPAADATAAPPANSIAIEISSSNTKEDWMNAVVAQFNQEGHRSLLEMPSSSR